MTAPDEQDTSVLASCLWTIMSTSLNCCQFAALYRRLPHSQRAQKVTGLELAISERPDCVVIDVMMPGIDGFQLAHALRGDPETAEIPLVMLTALAQEENRPCWPALWG